MRGGGAKLQLIKNYLRSTLNQALSTLTILSVESCATEGIDFDDVISKIAVQRVEEILRIKP